jgi:TetR/AcrR family transcriptional regulator
MPTSTFNNLDESKRKQIFDACVDEFATHTFSEASINQIIKAAGIPRGSFYQYFADKEDCYMFLLNEIAKEKMVLFKDIVTAKDYDTVFEEYESMFDQAILWIEENLNTIRSVSRWTWTTVNSYGSCSRVIRPDWTTLLH